MIENALSARRFNFKTKMTVKALISLVIVALAVTLPNLAHMAFGAQAGMKWLPMYLPVILGGCLLGARWGALIGVSAPLVSFALTSFSGNPMPTLARLPFMMTELAIFAVIAGLFSDKLSVKPLLAFPAVWLAELCGRGVFLACAALLGKASGLTAAVVFSQIKFGASGLLVQAVLAPALVIGLKYLIDREAHE